MSVPRGATLGHLTQPTTQELVMTADVSLEQFVHLKQPASDYLSQVYQISFKLNVPVIINKATIDNPMATS